MVGWFDVLVVCLVYGSYSADGWAGGKKIREYLTYGLSDLRS
jgi:hypothetical protein